MSQEAIARMYGIAWLLRRGYEVYPNICFNGAVDVIAIKDGVVEPLDIKSNLRFGVSNGGARGTQSRTEEQIVRGVKFLWVQSETDCYISDSSHRPTPQIEIDWEFQQRADVLDKMGKKIEQPT